MPIGTDDFILSLPLGWSPINHFEALETEPGDLEPTGNKMPAANRDVSHGLSTNPSPPPRSCPVQSQRLSFQCHIHIVHTIHVSLGWRPCYSGVMNEGCVVVGRPHPSHSLTEPHSTVYGTAHADCKKDFRRMKLRRMKIQRVQDEGVDCSSHRMRFWRFLKGSVSSQWSPLGNSIGNLRKPLEAFKIPHKCCHTTG